MAKRIEVEPTLKPVTLSGVPSIQSSDVSQGWQRAPESNAALEIAGAFAAVNPAIKQVVDIQTEKSKQADYLAAKQEAASNTLDQNKAALADLSRKGAIEEGANPWTNIYRSEILAHTLVTQQISQEAGENLQKVSTADNKPEDAKNYLAQLHNQYASQLGDNPYAQKAFESAFSSLSNEFLQQSEATRRKNIIVQASEGFQNNVGDILKYYNNADQMDDATRNVVSSNIKLALDNARQHGIVNANKLFLEQFKGTVADLAQTDPVKASATLSILDDVKPNGKDSIALTADGSEAVNVLRKHISECQRRIVENQNQAIRAQKEKTNSDIQDFATMWREKNPQATSQDLGKALSDNFGRTNPDVIRMTNKMVDSDRSRTLSETRQSNEENMNTFVQAMSTGNLAVAKTMLDKGVFYGEPYAKAKELFNNNIYLDKKIGGNAEVLSSFGIIDKTQTTDDQKNALVNVNKAILQRSMQLGVSPLEVYNNSAEMSKIVNAEKLNYENVLKAQEPAKKEQLSMLDKVGSVADSVITFPRRAAEAIGSGSYNVWNALTTGDNYAQVARGIASAPLQAAKNIWGTTNWAIDKLYGSKSELVSKWEQNADYLASTIAGEGNIADMSKHISANIVETMALGGGGLLKLAGKSMIAGFTDNEGITSTLTKNETTSRLASGAEAGIGILGFGLAGKLGSAGLKLATSKLKSMTDKIFEGFSPFGAAAKIAEEAGHPEVAQAIASADKANISAVKEGIKEVIAETPTQDLYDRAYANVDWSKYGMTKKGSNFTVDNYNDYPARAHMKQDLADLVRQQQAKEALGAVPKEVIDSGKTLEDKSKNIVDHVGRDANITFSPDIQILAHYSKAMKSGNIDEIAKFKPFAEQAIDNLNKISTSELRISKEDAILVNSLKQQTLDKLQNFKGIHTKEDVEEHINLLRHFGKISVLNDRIGTSSAISLEVRKELGK